MNKELISRLREAVEITDKEFIAAVADALEAAQQREARLNRDNANLFDELKKAQERIAELEHSLKLANESCGEWADENEKLEAKNERLRAALDRACEAIETQPQVGRSIDYANGFRRGVQCQRIRAKFARDEALAAAEVGDE